MKNFVAEPKQDKSGQETRFRDAIPGKDGRVTIYDHARANTASTTSSSTITISSDYTTTRKKTA